MKKLLAILLSVAVCSLLAFSLVGCAKEQSSDNAEKVGFDYEIVEDEENGDYAVLKQYTISEADANKVANRNYADIMVDLTVNEYKVGDTTYPVREISASAFANQLVIRSLVIGPNVETIGSAILSGCSNLEKLTVPFVGSTVDAVNEAKVLGYLFGTASYDGATAKTMSYNATGSSTFYIPDSLKEVTVTGDALSNYAFYGLDFTKVELTGNVETIGNYAFYGMNNLTSYRVPQSVKTIGDYAFASCSNLAEVNFESATALTSIGDHAFEGCSLLGYGKDNVLTLPATVTEIGDYAFASCTTLSSVQLEGTGVTVLNECVFYGCTKLSKVTLNADTEAKLYAFGNCDVLQKLYEQDELGTAITNADTLRGTNKAFNIPEEFVS
ncbi:MAG: leucine-rich repeat protein [Clostridia bacterium]|nr:leucine-rich repeat protein [Clostridia bacterium]